MLDTMILKVTFLLILQIISIIDSLYYVYNVKHYKNNYTKNANNKISKFTHKQQYKI